jgi:hypothetical protein
MNEIFALQKNDKSLRPAVAQEQVLGFHLMDLQKELIRVYGMPPLLTQLMDDEAELDNRAKNVSLAVNLARHSANGWDDAALPDDYEAIAAFLHVNVDRVRVLIGAPEAKAP